MAEANGRKVVLLAEDDMDQAYLARRMLERRGFVVVTAMDGEQTLALMEALEPHALVLDLVMPGIDGFEVLKAMAERAGPNPPVIAVSSFRGYLPKALDLGAAEALRKPYSQRLVERVAALVDGEAGLQRPAQVAEEETRSAEEQVVDEERRSATAEEVVQLVGGVGRSPDPILQDLAERTARVYDVRGCLVVVVTRDREIWVAGTGVPGAPGRSRTRAGSFCSHSIATRAALVVHDTDQNPFFRESESRRLGLRFYAGVPLTSRTGEPLGSLCLIDHRPRDFSWIELELLGALARAVVGTIEWREREARPREPVSSFRHLDFVDPELMVLGRDGFDEVLRHLADRAADYPDDPEDRLTLLVSQVDEDRLAGIVEALREAFPVAMLGRLSRYRIGVAVVGADAEAALRVAKGAVEPEVRVVARDVTQGSQQATETLRASEAELESGGEAPGPRPVLGPR